MPRMARRRQKTLSDQLRQAIKTSGHTRYAICKATGIDQAAMSKFMKGQVGLSLASLEQLTDFLRLELVRRPDKKGR